MKNVCWRLDKCSCQLPYLAITSVFLKKQTNKQKKRYLLQLQIEVQGVGASVPVVATPGNGIQPQITREASQLSSAHLQCFSPSFFSSISPAQASFEVRVQTKCEKKLAARQILLLSFVTSLALYSAICSPHHHPPLPSLATSFTPSARCTSYPLYFQPSAPPSPCTPLSSFFFSFSFFCFIICNMIQPFPVHAA